MYFMKLNKFTKWAAMLGRWTATMVFCVVATTFVWQGAFLSNTQAIAAPHLIATSAGDKIEQAADDVRAGSKDLIRDVKGNVKKAAADNAAKVDRADDEGSFVERKAKEDKARVQSKAEADAARTENVVDKSMDAVKSAVNKVESVFSK